MDTIEVLTSEYILKDKEILINYTLVLYTEGTSCFFLCNYFGTNITYFIIALRYRNNLVILFTSSI